MKISRNDGPKLLGDPTAREVRLAQVEEPHVRSLTAFVHNVRRETGPEAKIPYFDPWDGGVKAEVLFLAEAPGPKAVLSGFVSQNNPDESAKNSFQFIHTAGIPRNLIVRWNVVPWYIGSGKKIRAANSLEVRGGSRYLKPLFNLLPNLRAVVLVGKKSQTAEGLISSIRPNLKVFKSPHPSPMFVNRAPENRAKILVVFQEVADFLMKSGRTKVPQDKIHLKSIEELAGFLRAWTRFSKDPYLAGLTNLKYAGTRYLTFEFNGASCFLNADTKRSGVFEFLRRFDQGTFAVEVATGTRGSENKLVFSGSKISGFYAYTIQ